LDVYPYDQWYNKTIPYFEERSTFEPTTLLMTQGETIAPGLLTEEGLIGLMDSNSIGTDATIAQHIKTVLDRKYAIKKGNVYEPLLLGIALIEAYNDIGFKLSQPHLRAKMENEMKKISLGTKSKELVLMETLQMYKSVYVEVVKSVSKMDLVLKKYFEDVGEQSIVLDNHFSKCKCGTWMSLTNVDENRFVYCPTCAQSLPIPRNGDIKAVEHICPLCNYMVLNINGQYHVCPWCFSNPPDIENTTQLAFKCFNCNEKTCPLSNKQETYGVCPDCKDTLILKKNKTSWVISCKGYPTCTHTIWLPKESKTVECTRSCTHCQRNRLHFVFETGSMPPHIGEDVEVCIYCSPILNEFIGFPRPSPIASQRPKRVENNQVQQVNAKKLRQEVNTIQRVQNTKTSTIPVCEHNQPCVIRRSKKENENKGKEFWCCSIQTNGCKFFQWKE
jgi:DNA topoisomerase-3